ncbi:MAG: hypothetical protein D6788_01220 [Planctomycetota bacterium]|nr:MAG: hypothetical protein D6788_01220 [Planctomycetota bacterium]
MDSRKIVVRLLRAGMPASAAIMGLLSFAPKADGGRPEMLRPPVEVYKKGPGISNHPVGVRPSPDVRVPDGWPLGPGGVLTCSTCHAQLPGIRGGGNPHLRGTGDTGGLPFCGQCHTNGGSSRSAVHWMGLGRAHIRGDDRLEGISGTGLDPISRRCLTCHDGVSGTDALNGPMMMRETSFVGDRGRNHPVGIAYAPSLRRRAEVPLRPAALLPANMPLPGGKVSCISCHDIYAPQRGLLTVPIEGSKLCMTCHDMR